MKRNELKAKMQELGLEVNDDLINYVMAQNGADIESLKNQHTNELQTLNDELTQSKNKIQELEANTSQYSDYEELKQFKEGILVKQENEQRLNYLKQIKCKHPELFVDKIDWAKATFNDEKKVYEGLDDQVKNFKEQYSSMFEIQQQQSINPTTTTTTDIELSGVEKAFYANNPELRK